MSDVSLYDTRTRSLQPFAPRDPARVGIYACGPTVYARVHVGNARPFVVFSQLKRFLEHEGYGVTLVGNITDINDKIYTAAVAAGKPSGDLAAEMAALYREDTDRIGLGRPDAEPLATEYVPHIVELIQRLIDTDAAYVASGDVYFRVRTVDSYGELSRRDLDQMDQGEGVEGASLKEDPLDFALWKAWKEGEDTSWDAPWGRGRPGWHIECSAMAEALLGVEFDIHGGGVDLVFPHHENEAAQTFAARGKPLARIWMHNGMLELGDAEKMSKSVGNIRGLHEVLDAVGGDVLILFFSSGHYRQPLAFSDERLEDARRVGGADPRRLAAAREGRRVPGRAGRLPRRVLRRAAQRLQHRRGARLAIRMDSRGQSVLGAGGRLPPEGDARRAWVDRPDGRGCGGAGRGLGVGPPARHRAREQGLGRGRPPARRAARDGLGSARRT